MDVEETLNAVFEGLEKQLAEVTSPDDRKRIVRSVRDVVINIAMIGISQAQQEVEKSRCVQASWMLDLAQSFEDKP